MITFFIALVALVLGYFLYGRLVERIFAPDDRTTSAVSRADGVDFMVLPNWKIFMIQFLNIAGTGPIFGAIMGAKFGPAAYLWIVFGCIFAGAMHDYMSGMLSMRHDGAGLPELIGKYLGQRTKKVMLVFTVFLLMMVGAVFVYSPAEILNSLYDNSTLWIILIFAYYIIATMLPIDKIIGRFYPLFAIALLFMAVALFVVLLVKMPQLPELWDGVASRIAKDDGSGSLFPYLFITIACGAISGFHATQSPLMARCIKSERQGRPIFYGAMITEGIVALIWATVASYFFYAQPEAGCDVIAGASDGLGTSAPKVVDLICNDWLGTFGAILAMLGVVAAPITSGDTALRSARLIVAEFLKFDQKSIRNRLIICIPMFAAVVALLLWQINDKAGFNVLWQYFGWSNQALSVFTLWTLTVWMVQTKRAYVVALVPALFMTVITSTWLLVSPDAFGLDMSWAGIFGGAALLVAAVWFTIWMVRQRWLENRIRKQ